MKNISLAVNTQDLSDPNNMANFVALFLSKALNKPVEEINSFGSLDETADGLFINVAIQYDDTVKPSHVSKIR